MATMSGEFAGYSPKHKYEPMHEETAVRQHNNAMLLGNDIVKLATRIHGTCEVQGYVMPHNQAWFYGLIQEALDKGIFREDMGWEKLVSKTSMGPIVLSHSSGRAFPPHLDDPEWQCLSRELQFRSCLQYFPKEREIAPETLTHFWDDGRTYFHTPREELLWSNKRSR